MPSSPLPTTSKLLLLICIFRYNHAFIVTPSSPRAAFATKRSTSSLFAGGGQENASTYVRKGMISFVDGKVDDSISFFDKAESIDPSIRGVLWQRGISYYYADRFDDGSKQVGLCVYVRLWNVYI
mmetsp:Transcript_35468/g.54515  ORF Transcript_35468/g.54515 Transcript_35468/m.54515 type:complete len:125 (-) Transcript_35468:590-964(-)